MRASSLNHNIYNVAAGQTNTVNELVEIAREKLPDLKTQVGESTDLDIDYDPGCMLGRWGAYDISRIHQDTGWQPRSLREAFHAYLEWIEEFELG